MNSGKRGAGDLSSSARPFSPSPFLLTFVNQLADFGQILQRAGCYISTTSMKIGR